ncbi:hypothetical protein OSTOST_21463, partial [Ostertagia ostertagi]
NGCERRGVDWKNTPVLLTGELFSTGPEFSRYAQQTASPLIIMKHLNAALIVGVTVVFLFLNIYGLIEILRFLRDKQLQRHKLHDSDELVEVDIAEPVEETTSRRPVVRTTTSTVVRTTHRTRITTSPTPTQPTTTTTLRTLPPTTQPTGITTMVFMAGHIPVSMPSILIAIITPPPLTTKCFHILLLQRLPQLLHHEFILLPTRYPILPPDRSRIEIHLPHSKETVRHELPRDDVTIVTALMDIGRGEWDRYRRPLEQYHLFMENLLSLQNY